MTFTPKKGVFAGQTFSSERQYRNALAQRKGYSSSSAWRRAPKPVRGIRQLTALVQSRKRHDVPLWMRSTACAKTGSRSRKLREEPVRLPAP